MEGYVIKPVAHIKNGFGGKFGIPRQSNIVGEVVSEIIFEPEFRSGECLRGIEGFSHLWLIWHFSESAGKPHSQTVRPPRLGGNTRVGVFATRSPFRPNDLGLSCVRLLCVEKREGEGCVLKVAGADILNGSAIFDIKPYLPYADKIENAAAGFAPDSGETLEVTDPRGLLCPLCESDRAAVKALLSQDPRPRYQNDPGRVYGMTYGDNNIKFTVDGGKAEITGVEMAD